MKLLIAENERSLAAALTALFEKNRFTVDTVFSGEVAYTYAAGEYDALLLGSALPELNGVEITKKLRDDGVETPIMLLTENGTKQERIMCFNAGADDCLPSAFEPDELICRVRAMLRRGTSYKPQLLSFGEVVLDCGTAFLSCNGESIQLSGKEFQIAELFLSNPRVVLSAEKIIERVWGWDTDTEINVVWVHISNLRKKLKAINSPVTVRVKRGLGYALEEAERQ